MKNYGISIYLVEAVQVCCWHPRARMKSVRWRSPGWGTTSEGRRRPVSSVHCWPGGSLGPSDYWPAGQCWRLEQFALPPILWGWFLVKHWWSFVNLIMFHQQPVRKTKGDPYLRIFFYLPCMVIMNNWILKLIHLHFPENNKMYTQYLYLPLKCIDIGRWHMHI